MKHLLNILLLMAVVSSAAAKSPAKGPTTIPANDSKIVYEGRTLTEDGTVSFNWSGTSVRIVFEGSSLQMRCSDSHCDYLNVHIDKALSAKHDKVLKINSDTLITIASGLKKGRHEVVLQKRSEGNQGILSIKSFTTDGKFAQAVNPYKRHIEFIGDSYTCGYGTEAADKYQHFKPEEENSNLTYAAILGRYFDAEVRTISHSGIGVVRNYNDSKSATMVEDYGRMFDGKNDSPAWKAGSDGFKPDLVVIYLGTNDFSVRKQPSLGSWCAGYEKLLRQVRENYGPDVPILCMASRINEMMGYYVKTAVERSSFGNLHFTEVLSDTHNEEDDMGADGHPNYKGHRKIASMAAPYVATVTGWELPFKTIE